MIWLQKAANCSYLFQKPVWLFQVRLQIHWDHRKEQHVAGPLAYTQEKEALKCHQIWLPSGQYLLFFLDIACLACPWLLAGYVFPAHYHLFTAVSGLTWSLVFCVCDTGNSCRLDRWNPLRKWSWTPPGGYTHTLPIRVCAAQRGRDFEAPDLERGIDFRGVF